MGRDLILYPTQVREDDIDKACEPCSTLLNCHRSGGEFLSQCGVYYDINEDESPPQILDLKPVPPSAKFWIRDAEDGGDEPARRDRIHDLHYCRAGDFSRIDKSLCDNSNVNLAAVAYCRALRPDTVVIVYIS